MPDLTKVVNDLKKFIDAAKEKRRIYPLWIGQQSNFMQVYVRKSNRYLNRQTLVTLDIATVSIEEEYQKQGYFSEFIKKAHELNPWDATFLENVLYPELVSSLIRKGWKPIPDFEESITSYSFYMLKKEG
jgi:hypothetical protein